MNINVLALLFCRSRMFLSIFCELYPTKYPEVFINFDYLRRLITSLNIIEMLTLNWASLRKEYLLSIQKRRKLLTLKLDPPHVAVGYWSERDSELGNQPDFQLPSWQSSILPLPVGRCFLQADLKQRLFQTIGKLSVTCDASRMTGIKNGKLISAELPGFKFNGD